MSDLPLLIMPFTSHKAILATRNLHVLVVSISQQHPFNGSLSGTTQVSWYQKGKTNLNLLEQETGNGSGISWAICKSALRPRQIPCQHPTTQFLQARCPSCHPTNSVKALKAKVSFSQIHHISPITTFV